MSTILPQTYLIGLVLLLLIISILLGRQFLKVRKDEMNLIKLEKAEAKSSKDASELYELATVQIRKRLFPQAIVTLKKALKHLDNEPNEARALIENALGFSLAAQDDFKSAIIHYKIALKAKFDYPVALNNLAFAKIRLSEESEAMELYKQVLELEPKNKTALKQMKKIQANSKGIISETNKVKGFDN